MLLHPDILNVLSSKDQDMTLTEGEFGNGYDRSFKLSTSALNTGVTLRNRFPGEEFRASSWQRKHSPMKISASLLRANGCSLVDATNKALRRLGLNRKAIERHATKLGVDSTSKC